MIGDGYGYGYGYGYEKGYGHSQGYFEEEELPKKWWKALFQKVITSKKRRNPLKPDPDEKKERQIDIASGKAKEKEKTFQPHDLEV